MTGTNSEGTIGERAISGDAVGGYTVGNEAGPGRASQRLDAWLWCARVLKQRPQCAELAAAGVIRINRRPTDKPHAAIRPGDVLTLPVGGRVRVFEVLALATRRGPPSAARLLYREIAEPGTSCAPDVLLSDGGGPIPRGVDNRRER